MIRLTNEAAGSVTRVVAEKPIVCWITGFSNSSIDFVLRFWVRDRQAGLTNVKGEVYLSLWDAFKANGFTIPFPQREAAVRMVQANEGIEPPVSAPAMKADR